MYFYLVKPKKSFEFKNEYNLVKVPKGSLSSTKRLNEETNKRLDLYSGRIER